MLIVNVLLLLLASLAVKLPTFRALTLHLFEGGFTTQSGLKL